jgi:hypothetical protein
MIIDVREFTQLTIRARAAFALLITGSLLRDADGYDEAHEALRIGSAWVAGEEVTGTQLRGTLLDPEDRGLFVYVSRKKQRNTDAAYRKTR